MTPVVDSVTRWADPPDKGARRKKYNWMAIVAELRQRPGCWALVAEGCASGHAQVLRDVGCEVRTTVGSDPANHNRRDIYARWPDTQNGDAS